MEKNTRNPQTWMEISLTQIDDTFMGYRLITPQAHRKIMQSIRHYGQIFPVVVGRKEKRYELIDGFKRFRACCELNNSTIKATILPGNVRTFKAALVRLNWGSRSITDFEEAMVLSSLVQDDCLTQKEVATLFGRHKSWVCRRISLVDRLSEEVITQIKLGLVTTTTGRELARLPRGNREVALKTILRARLTCREAAQLVTLLHEHPKQKHELILQHGETFVKHKDEKQVSKSLFKKEVRSYHGTLIAIEELMGRIALQDFGESLPKMTKQDRQSLLSSINHIESNLSYLKKCTLNFQKMGRPRI